MPKRINVLMVSAELPRRLRAEQDLSGKLRVAGGTRVVWHGKSAPCPRNRGSRPLRCETRIPQYLATPWLVLSRFARKAGPVHGSIRKRYKRSRHPGGLGCGPPVSESQP